MRITRLFFVRHGEHVSASELKSGKPALTPRGIQESKQIGLTLNVEAGHAIAFGYAEDRAIHTLVHALYPSAKPEETLALSRHLICAGRIGTMSDLDYFTHHNSTFHSRMGDAFFSRRGLAFLAQESDKFITDSRNEVSCYSRTAMQVAKILLSQLEIHNASIAGPPRAGQAKEASRVFCAREFVFPCFRAKVLEMQMGVRARDSYSDWYGYNVELADSARVGVIRVAIAQSNEVTISDSYGSITCSAESLNRIVGEYQYRINGGRR